MVWPTFFVLLLQAVFFAHGGITTLGINTLTLGFFGPLCTIGLWNTLEKSRLNSTIGLGIACAVGSLSVYFIDALVLAIALSDLTPPASTFTSVSLGFAPVQVPLSILEAFVSVKIVLVLASRRADLLPTRLSMLRSPSVPVEHMILLFCVGLLSGCDYEGIDGTVFGKMAEHAGCVVMCDIEKISIAHKLMLNFCFNIDPGEGGLVLLAPSQPC